MYSFSFQHQMSIPPNPPWEATHITFCQIHPSNKTNTSVNNNNFPVITIIHFTSEQWKADFQKTAYLDTCLAHFFKKTMGYMPTTYIIINDTYFYSFFCLIYQDIAHHTSNCIVLKDIKLNMNMFFRFLQLAQKRLQHWKSQCISFYTVTIKRKSLVSITE